MSEGAVETADVLAFDGGQSGVRYRFLRGGAADGQIVAEGDLGPIYTDKPLRPQLQAATQAAIEAAGVTAPVFAGGFTGLRDDESPKDLLDHLYDEGFREVHLAHDSTTSYLGALGHQSGVVTASGTGVVTLAVGASRVARVDGWGWIIGDAGSGFSIGRAALDAVMRAFDGRGPETSLTEVVTAEFPDLPETYLILQADDAKVSRIARYAKVVSEHAAAGDEVALGISRWAAGELAHSALSGLAVVGEHQRDDPAVSALGNVFRNEVIAERFAEVVLVAHPRARVLKALGSGLEGASRLPEIADDEALAARILRARV